MYKSLICDSRIGVCIDMQNTHVWVLLTWLSSLRMERYGHRRQRQQSLSCFKSFLVSAYTQSLSSSEALLI